MTAQLELLNDVDLAAFSLEMRNKAGISVVDAITDANIGRTVEGASTLTVNVEDDSDHTILRSGFLGRRMNVNLDNLMFTLVGVKKQQRNLALTFEEYEINLLRYYDSFLAMTRDQVTRAEFVLRMIKEVKEKKLNYVIPELKALQPISDLQPNQIIVDASGKPISTNKDPNAALNRQAGIPLVVDLTVKGQPATAEQINNANTVISTGVGMGARRKILVCSIMTAIDESLITNLTGGDLDSVGVFQQRHSQGWPATRNVAVDAQAFFQRAIAQDGINPNLSYNDLCQAVQHSGTPFAYGKFQAEAEAFVTAYGEPGADFSVDPGTVNNSKVKSVVALGAYQYTRGQLVTDSQGQHVLTKENSWACMQRLAAEVNWRCFCVSGSIYFISEAYLFKSKPTMTISEKSKGIDWIDFDFDEGKRVATVTITCHLSRWSAPPGSIVLISGMGTILNGRWLVNDVNRSLYNTQGTVTLKKPLPKLPEPTTSSKQAANTPVPAGPSTPAGPVGTAQAQIVAYARSQLGVPYAWGAEDPSFAFDCSGLAQAAYDSAGIKLPRVAQAQYDAGPKLSVVDVLQPADLVFFGTLPNGVEHVGIYIGNGAMIDAPHTGAFVRVDDGFTGWTDPPYVGATRPWQ